MKLTRSSVQPNNKAAYDTDETYIELSIPVVDESMGLTFGGYGIQELRVDFQEEKFDNTFSGEYTVESENIYWQISDDLALRGGTQNAVRTPDLQSVFGPQATTYRTAKIHVTIVTLIVVYIQMSEELIVKLSHGGQLVGRVRL